MAGRRLSDDDDTADAEVAKVMASLADVFVQGTAEEAGIALQWGESDAATLDGLCDAFLRSRPPEDVKHSMILGMGAYLGELIIRNTDARWSYDRSHSEAIVVTREGLVSYPHSKVAKRLTIGAEHNLYQFYLYAVRREVLPDTTVTTIDTDD